MKKKDQKERDETKVPSETVPYRSLVEILSHQNKKNAQKKGEEERLFYSFEGRKRIQDQDLTRFREDPSQKVFHHFLLYPRKLL